MKNAIAAALLALTAVPVYAADVGVSIGVPGIFGRIELGDGYPQPHVINRQPVYIQRGPQVEQPVYLHVPVEHQRNWRRYCGQYGACGQPVYFVQDNWYRNQYQPRYAERHRDDGRRDDERRDDRRGRGRDDHNDDRHDDHGDHGDRGRGHDGR